MLGASFLHPRRTSRVWPCVLQCVFVCLGVKERNLTRSLQWSSEKSRVLCNWHASRGLEKIHNRKDSWEQQTRPCVSWSAVQRQHQPRAQQFHLTWPLMSVFLILAFSPPLLSLLQLERRSPSGSQERERHNLVLLLVACFYGMDLKCSPGRLCPLFSKIFSSLHKTPASCQLKVRFSNLYSSYKALEPLVLTYFFLLS